MSKPSAAYRRPQYSTLLSRLNGPRQFIQVLAGPRQVGKTTLARQAMEELDAPSHYASADAATLQDASWIAQQWETARALAGSSRTSRAILVLDEIQKVSHWSEEVKRQWDEDSASHLDLHVVTLGSSPLLVERGLTESLAGRFEMIRLPHWSFSEMSAAFSWNLDRYIYFGGYPGSAQLVEDQSRWSSYVLDSLIETTVSRDILLMSRVDKPALLRRVFQLACEHSSQILSYQKMIGQLADAGNTTTIAHYLDLLSGAGLVSGIQKFSGQRPRRRASSPKLQVLNTALMSAVHGSTFEETRSDHTAWGRWTESAIGAHLVNSALGTGVNVYYWRDRNREVDFVLQKGKRITAIEVKSSARSASIPGLTAFSDRYRPDRSLLVGGDGLSLTDFFDHPAIEWVE